MIKNLTFVLENCEHITVKGNTIGSFDIMGIEKVIRRVACNEIGKYEVANSVAIELFPEADTKYNSFGEVSKSTAFKRLSEYADITGIEIEYENGEIESFLVDYDTGEYDYLGADNINQKTYISTQGNLYILIDTKKALFDVFPKDEIEDKDTIEYLHDAYNIGIETESEHEWSPKDMPELYKYFQLAGFDDRGQMTYSTAVRVPDGDGWKLIYEKDDTEIRFPKTWEYFNSKLQKFINDNNEDFSIEKIKEMYPEKTDDMIVSDVSVGMLK